MKRIITLISLAACIIATGCHSEKEEEHEELKFWVTSPLSKDTAITKEYVCQIHSIQHIEIRSIEKGYLQNIFVDEGQHVKKGQPLFQIMPTIYEAELQEAQAEARVAEIEYRNTKALADSNIVSQNELALVKARYDKVKAALSLAQAHLNFTDIHAPFDGLIDRFHARLGSLLDEGELLTELSDNSSLWVYFNVPEAEYLDYMGNAGMDNGKEVELLMANGRVFDQMGKISTIQADFNHETGNIAFRATFPNPKGMLRHGETGTVLMRVPLKDALLIPQKSTFEVLDKQYVYVVDAEHTIHSREVTIGAELPHLYAVTAGLKPDDKILLEGLRKVRENNEIDYDFVEPDSALSQLDLYAE